MPESSSPSSPQSNSCQKSPQVMERLEDKHQKARSEKRTERLIRLQRLMATDPELKRPRCRWKESDWQAGVCQKNNGIYKLRFFLHVVHANTNKLLFTNGHVFYCSILFRIFLTVIHAINCITNRRFWAKWVHMSSNICQIS